jgi:hypothetical protein
MSTRAGRLGVGPPGAVAPFVPTAARCLFADDPADYDVEHTDRLTLLMCLRALAKAASVYPGVSAAILAEWGRTFADAYSGYFGTQGVCLPSPTARVTAECLRLTRTAPTLDVPRRCERIRFAEALLMLDTHSCLSENLCNNARLLAAAVPGWVRACEAIPSSFLFMYDTADSGWMGRMQTWHDALAHLGEHCIPLGWVFHLCHLAPPSTDALDSADVNLVVPALADYVRGHYYM